MPFAGHSPSPDPSGEQRILFVQHSADFSGSTISGHLTACGLVRDGFTVDVVLGTEGPYAALYSEGGCQVHWASHKNWLRGGNSLRWTKRTLLEIKASQAFVHLIQRLNPRLIYINSLVSLAAAVAARRCSIPCIWHIRELFEDVGGEMKLPPLGGRAAVRFFLRRLAQQYVAISRAVADNVLGPTLADRTTILPNAVSDEFFELQSNQAECRHELGLPNGVPLVGVPGTLRPMKGHPFFLQAAAVLANRLPKIAFAFTGGGNASYRAELLELIKQSRLEGRVQLLGSVQRMPQFYRACDVVCVPSRAEPFGRVVIEAFAAGTPVVASAVGGIPEIIDPDVTGLLVDYADSQALAAKIQQLLDDAALRQRLVESALIKAGENYTSEIYRRRIGEVVRSVLAK